MQAAPVQQELPKLTTAVVTSTIMLPGRAIVDTRNNHWVINSPAALGGPNQAVNPLDALLSRLQQASGGIFIYEKAAQGLNIPLEQVLVTEGDFAVQGLKDGSVNPRIRALPRQAQEAKRPQCRPGQLTAERSSRSSAAGLHHAIAGRSIDIIHVGMDDECGGFAGGQLQIQRVHRTISRPPSPHWLNSLLPWMGCVGKSGRWTRKTASSAVSCSLTMLTSGTPFSRATWPGP